MNRYFYPGRGVAEDKIKARQLLKELKSEFEREAGEMKLNEFLAFRWANVAVAERELAPEDKLFLYRGCGLSLSSCFRCASGRDDAHCLYKTIRMAIINALESFENIQSEIIAEKKEGGES